LVKDINMAHEIIRESFHKNLSVKDIQDIRQRYLEGETQKSIGDDFGCSIKLIYSIVHLKAYKDVEVEANYKELLENRK